MGELRGWLNGPAWAEGGSVDDGDPKPQYVVSTSPRAAPVLDRASAKLVPGWDAADWEPVPEPEQYVLMGLDQPRCAQASDKLALLSEQEGGNAELNAQQRWQEQLPDAPAEHPAGRSDWKLFALERQEAKNASAPYGRAIPLLVYSRLPLSQSDSARPRPEHGSDISSTVSLYKPGAGTVLQHGDYARRISPSSEALAFYASAPKQSAVLQNKRVLEIGAGLGLPGLAVAVWADAEAVHLTDGDAAVVENLQRSIQKNSDNVAFGTTAVSAWQLDWEVPAAAVSEEQQYDIILASDTICSRVDAHDSHSPLLSTMRRWLKPDGLVLVMAPRDHRLGSFMKAANQGSQAFGFVGQSLEFEGASVFSSMKCGPVLIKMTNPRLRPHQVFQPARAKRLVPGAARMTNADAGDASRAKGSRRRRRKNLKANAAAARSLPQRKSSEPETDPCDESKDATLSGPNFEGPSTSWSSLDSCSLPDVHARRARNASSRRMRTRVDSTTAERNASSSLAVVMAKPRNQPITAECSVLSYARTDCRGECGAGSKRTKSRNRNRDRTAGQLAVDTVFRLVRAGAGRSKQKYVIGSRDVLRNSKSSTSGLVLDTGLIDSSSTCFLSVEQAQQQAQQQQLSLRIVPGFPHRPFQVTLTGEPQEVVNVCETIRGAGCLLLTEKQSQSNSQVTV
eukprot:COSAG02_NODE_1378_length_12990_cov_3.643705_5_plen_679_part_00